MIPLTTLNPKLIIAGILLLAMGAGGFYIWTLNKRIDSLKEDKIELTAQVKQAEETIQEQQRMDSVINDISNLGNEERVIIRKEYETKIKRIDNDVQTGIDKPVGNLLNDFFNNGLYKKD